MKTVAEQFAETLSAAGVKRIYGIVGDSLNGLTDALRRQGKIEWVHVRHEEVAAFAAGAEAHLTGELAVCAGSCGPGNLQLINGLFDCHRSRVPVLAIAAHIPSAEIGSGFFQETAPDLGDGQGRDEQILIVPFFHPGDECLGGTGLDDIADDVGVKEIARHRSILRPLVTRRATARSSTCRAPSTRGRRIGKATGSPRSGHPDGLCAVQERDARLHGGGLRPRGRSERE